MVWRLLTHLDLEGEIEAARLCRGGSRPFLKAGAHSDGNVVPEVMTMM